MDLEKQLKSTGYYDAVADLETAIKHREALARMLENNPPPADRLQEGLDLLALMDEGIARGTEALKTEYEAACDYVDRVNDFELHMLQGEEIMEQSVEYYETVADDPDKVARARALLKKIKGEEDDADADADA